MPMKRFRDAAPHPLKTGDRAPLRSGLTSAGYRDLPGPCSHPSVIAIRPARSVYIS